MSFRGNVVIVTGGSSGIGAATAVSFAKEGADVTIVGRNETKLQKVAQDISKVGNPPLIIKADVSKENGAESIIKNTIDKFGKFDVLVNNAGIYRIKTVFEGDHLQTYDEVMNINLRSVVHLTILAVPHLVKSKGNIVNVSSVAGKSPLAGRAAYCTSKAGLDHFSRVTALELADRGVRVNIVSPGPVETDIFKNAGMELDKDKILQQAKDITALKVITQPDEVADMILYLASDKARNITGGDFIIDAGVILKL